jgi:hypothetical protein
MKRHGVSLEMERTTLLRNFGVGMTDVGQMTNGRVGFVRRTKSGAAKGKSKISWQQHLPHQAHCI